MKLTFKDWSLHADHEVAIEWSSRDGREARDLFFRSLCEACDRTKPAIFGVRARLVSNEAYNFWSSRETSDRTKTAIFGVRARLAIERSHGVCKSNEIIEFANRTDLAEIHDHTKSEVQRRQWWKFGDDEWRLIDKESTIIWRQSLESINNQSITKKLLTRVLQCWWPLARSKASSC